MLLTLMVLNRKKSKPVFSGMHNLPVVYAVNPSHFIFAYSIYRGLHTILANRLLLSIRQGVYRGTKSRRDTLYPSTSSIVVDGDEPIELHSLTITPKRNSDSGVNISRSVESW